MGKVTRQRLDLTRLGGRTCMELKHIQGVKVLSIQYSGCISKFEMVWGFRNRKVVMLEEQVIRDSNNVLVTQGQRVKALGQSRRGDSPY